MVSSSLSSPIENFFFLLLTLFFLSFLSFDDVVEADNAGDGSETREGDRNDAGSFAGGVGGGRNGKCFSVFFPLGFVLEQGIKDWVVVTERT